MVETTAFPWLSLVVFGPAAGALFLSLLPSAREDLIRWGALIATAAVFLASLVLWWGFNLQPGFQFVEKLEWIPAIGAVYHLGVDGLSLFMVLLTTLIGFIVVLYSFKVMKEKVKAYYMTLLFLQAGMTGVFVALDLLLFYLFWEVTLIPMFLLIGRWGGARRIYAAVKFFLYTLAGSLLMLAAIIALYWYHYDQTGVATFDLGALTMMSYPARFQFWAFLGFFVAFAVKVPMFPFHTWLPDAHVEAPTAGSVVLAGVLLKMGTYGLVRFCLPLFPGASQQLAPVILTLGVIGIIYGALLALAQDDLKKLIAYSSISHLGFVVIGIFSFNTVGNAGAVLQMVNHGLITGALFLLVGMVYERTHQRSIPRLGGLAHRLPVYATLFTFFCLASLGLPGLAGFVGEFLVLLGVFQYAPIYAVLGALGVILGAAYLLWMLQRVIYGALPEEYRQLPDLSALEILCLLPLVILVLWIGVYPLPFLEIIESGLVDTLADFTAVAP
jgi:NADH-quinone oxidoreductase subunit M